MVKATPAPKPNKPQLIFLSYVYAAALVCVVLFELIGFGGFDFAGFEFEVIGQPFWVFSLALSQIFALPFVLGLNLSPLARAVSALLCLLTPFLFMAYKIFGAVNLFGALDLALGLLLIILGVANFVLLNGKTAVEAARSGFLKPKK